MYPSHKGRLAGYGAAVLSELLFGMSFIFTRIVVSEGIPSVWLLGWRFMIAFVFINLLQLTGLVRVRLAGRNLRPLLAIAILQPVVYFSCETAGIRLTTASESGTIIASIPVITLVLSAVVRHKKATAAQLAGILITVGGVVICTVFKGLSLSFSVAGYCLLFAAATSFAVYTVLADGAGRFSPAEITYVMAGAGAAVFFSAALVHSLARGETAAFLAMPMENIRFGTAVLYEGAVCSVICYMLVNLSLRQIGSVSYASFAGISTLVSIVTGVWLLRETFALPQVVGAAMIVAGAYLANSRKAA